MTGPELLRLVDVLESTGMDGETIVASLRYIEGENRDLSTKDIKEKLEALKEKK